MSEECFIPLHIFPPQQFTKKRKMIDSWQMKNNKGPKICHSIEGKAGKKKEPTFAMWSTQLLRIKDVYCCLLPFSIDGASNMELDFKEIKVTEMGGLGQYGVEYIETFFWIFRMKKLSTESIWKTISKILILCNCNRSIFFIEIDFFTVAWPHPKKRNGIYRSENQSEISASGVW